MHFHTHTTSLQIFILPIAHFYLLALFTNYRATLHTTVVDEASWQHCWLLYSSSSNESLTFDWSMSEDGTDLLQVVFHGEIRFVFFLLLVLC